MKTGDPIQSRCLQHFIDDSSTSVTHEQRILGTINKTKETNISDIVLQLVAVKNCASSALC